MRIVIDPGHGGHDPGAIGPSGVREASAALLLAMHLYPLLAVPGHRPELTRWDDRYVTLGDRVEMGRGAGVFVSLHFNAADTPEARGTETLYYPGSTSGRELAEEIQSRLIRALGTVDRGVKARKDLYVLRNTTCPAVLVEAAFVSHPDEERLFDPRGELRWYRAAAAAIAEGVLEWARQRA